MVRSASTRSKKDLVCCLDMGTSHIKAALLDDAGRVAALSFSPVPPSAPGTPPSEFDAAAHFRVACREIRRLTVAHRGIADRVKAIAVTGQRASIVPLYHDRTRPALGWSDTRGSAVLQRYRNRVANDQFRRLSGLPSSTLWSLAKILWLQQAPLRRRPARYALLNDYMLWRLGAPGLITDFSSASLTGLLDTRRLEWSPVLLRAAGLTEEHLPALAPSGMVVGSLASRVAARCGLRAGTPLVLAGGDQQCADLGMGVLDDDDAGICLGTAAVVTCPSARPITRQDSGIFCTVHVAPNRWVLEGIHGAFGSSLSWIRSVLSLPSRIRQVIAAGSYLNAPLFLPFLTGMGSPDFDPDVRGSFVGLDASHTANDLVRGVILGNALELRRILEAMGSFTSRRRLTITGGEARSRVAIQALADVTGCTLRVSSTPHATLLGAALLAWTATGRFRTLRDAMGSGVERSRVLVAPRTNSKNFNEVYARYLHHVDGIRRATHA